MEIVFVYNKINITILPDILHLDKLYFQADLIYEVVDGSRSHFVQVSNMLYFLQIDFTIFAQLIVLSNKKSTRILTVL